MSMTMKEQRMGRGRGAGIEASEELNTFPE
jgi:hypothetical protein